MIFLSDSLNVICMIGQKLMRNENNQISSRFNPVIPKSKVRSSFNIFFSIFFSTYSYRKCNFKSVLLVYFFLAKRHSLGVTGFSLNLGSIKSISHQT